MRHFERFSTTVLCINKQDLKLNNMCEKFTHSDNFALKLSQYFVEFWVLIEHFLPFISVHFPLKRLDRIGPDPYD